MLLNGVFNQLFAIVVFAEIVVVILHTDFFLQLFLIVLGSWDVQHFEHEVAILVLHHDINRIHVVGVLDFI